MSIYLKHRSSFLLSIVALGIVAATAVYRISRRPAPQEFNPKDILSQFKNAQTTESNLKRLIAQLPAHKIEFGKKLFFDQKLSATQNISCAHCHAPEKFFTDAKKTSEGVGKTSRNAPTIFYAALQPWLFWDGRAVNLIDQAQQPLENPLEHGFDGFRVYRSICENDRPEYEKIFGLLQHCDATDLARDSINASTETTTPTPKHSFSIKISGYILSTLPNFSDLHEILSEATHRKISPARMVSLKVDELNNPANKKYFANEEMNEEIEKVFFNVAQAIAVYEASIAPPETAFDRYRARVLAAAQKLDPANSNQADETRTNSFTAAQNGEFGPREFAGMTLFFGRAECHLCHRGLTLSDGEFHNTGLAQYNPQLSEIGRAATLAALKDHQNFCQKNDEPILRSAGCEQLDYIDVDQHKMVGAFKTAPLRFVSRTAPYFHDGRADSLDEVIEHYENLSNQGILGEITETLRPLKLSSEERSALIDFLKTL